MPSTAYSMAATTSDSTASNAAVNSAGGAALRSAVPRPLSNCWAKRASASSPSALTAAMIGFTFSMIGPRSASERPSNCARCAGHSLDRSCRLTSRDMETPPSLAGANISRPTLLSRIQEAAALSFERAAELRHLDRLLADRVEDGAGQPLELRRRQQLVAAGARQIDRHDRLDAAGPVAHDSDAVGEIDRLLDIVGDEEDREAV